MAKEYKIIDSRQVFQGKIFKIFVDNVRMPSGNIVEREVLSHFGAVGIVPITEKNEVILVEQYRHAARQRLWEIPAGKLDKDEDPRDCAVRELKEETGITAADIIKLVEFYNAPGYSNERFYLYMAKGLTIGEAQPDGDEEQDLKVIKLPLSKALSMMRSGEICDAKSIIGLLLAELSR